VRNAYIFDIYIFNILDFGFRKIDLRVFFPLQLHNFSIDYLLIHA